MTQDDEHPLVNVLAELTLRLGHLGEKLNAETKRREELNANIMPLAVDLTGVGTSATVDLPNVLGPLSGWYWDIATMICQGLTGGSVAVYENNTSGVQWANFTASGQLNWGKKQFWIAAGSRLLLVGSGSVPATGCSVTIRGTQVAARYWGDYAL